LNTLSGSLFFEERRYLDVDIFEIGSDCYQASVDAQLAWWGVSYWHQLRRGLASDADD
jgi:hypothetical protein